MSPDATLQSALSPAFILISDTGISGCCSEALGHCVWDDFGLPLRKSYSPSSAYFLSVGELYGGVISAESH